MNRDVNAAGNILKKALALEAAKCFPTVGTTESYACGDQRSLVVEAGSPFRKEGVVHVATHCPNTEPLCAEVQR